jgi:hypothetical protein
MRDTRTIRQKILDRLAEPLPSMHARSATRIALAIGERPDSVSSMLLFMMEKGDVRREPGGGPRGGYVYYLVEEARRTNGTNQA